MPGPPYLFGVFTVVVAMLIAFFIPKSLDQVYKPVLIDDTDAEDVTKKVKHFSKTYDQKKANGKLLSDSDEQSVFLQDESAL